MRWNLLFGVTIAMLLVVGSEWRKLRQRPTWDKVVLVCLSIAVWSLFLFDLPRTPGPTSLLEFVFKPFAGLTKP